MVALEISSMKNFMTHLLSGDTFEDYLLEEAVISTLNTFTIDGHMNADFFPAEERDTAHLPYDFRPWSELKGMCFDLIKGKYPPTYFKFVLHLKPEKASVLLREVSPELSGQLKALVLNIRYDGNKAILTTGTSYQAFVISREIDLTWDLFLCKYLDEKGIGYEKL